MSMYGKDKAFIENEQRFQRDRDYLNSPVYKPTVYKPVVIETIKTEEMSEPIECTPFMWGHPMGLLRWFELLMFFILQWLVQITCGGDACTMIMNVFGYTAMGQLFVLLIFLGLSILCALILVAFVLNAHRSFLSAIQALERVYALLGVVFMFISAILGTWMAVLANDPEVLEFLMVIVFIFDFILQRRETYPYVGKVYKTVPEQHSAPGSSKSTATITKRTEDFYFPENF